MAYQKSSSIYDYMVKSVENGTVAYYGAIVDGDQEILQRVPAQMFTSMVGRQDIYAKNTDGFYRFRRPRKYSKELISYNRLIGQKIGLPPATINKVLSWLGPKLETAIMYLHWKNIPIADINNAFEIFTKYFQHANHIPNNAITPHDYQVANSFHTTGRNENRFDIAAFASGIFDMLGNLWQQGGQQAAQQELLEWITAYKNYMITDFGDIQRENEEHGPAAALAWLKNLKQTSWKDLKDYNIAWCNSHHLEIPEPVLAVQQAQIDLENDLKLEIQNTSHGTPTNTNTQGPSDPSSNGTSHEFAPVTTGKDPDQPNKLGFDATSIMIAAAIFIVFVLLFQAG